MLYGFRLALSDPYVKQLSRVVIIIYNVRKARDGECFDFYCETALLLDCCYVFSSFWLQYPRYLSLSEI